MYSYGVQRRTPNSQLRAFGWQLVQVLAHALPQLQPQFRTLGSALGSQCVHLASMPVDVSSSWFSFLPQMLPGCLSAGRTSQVPMPSSSSLTHQLPVRCPTASGCNSRPRPFCPQSPVQSSPAPSSAVRRAYYRTGPKSWFQSGTTETSGRAGLVSLALKMPQRRRQAVSNHTPNFLHHQHPQMQMSLTPRQFQRAQGSPIATPPTPRLPKTDA
ncbi:hypothetical protein J3E68DRAFT_269161 [Trichoderma sp. SZMC 28012]